MGRMARIQAIQPIQAGRAELQRGWEVIPLLVCARPADLAAPGRLAAEAEDMHPRHPAVAEVVTPAVAAAAVHLTNSHRNELSRFDKLCRFSAMRPADFICGKG